MNNKIEKMSEIFSPAKKSSSTSGGSNPKEEDLSEFLPNLTLERGKTVLEIVEPSFLIETIEPVKYVNLFKVFEKKENYYHFDWNEKFDFEVEYAIRYLQKCQGENLKDFPVYHLEKCIKEIEILIHNTKESKRKWSTILGITMLTTTLPQHLKIINEQYVHINNTLMELRSARAGLDKTLTYLNTQRKYLQTKIPLYNKLYKMIGEGAYTLENRLSNY